MSVESTENLTDYSSSLYVELLKSCSSDILEYLSGAKNMIML